jgi:hypothetical protein
LTLQANSLGDIGDRIYPQVLLFDTSSARHGCIAIRIKASGDVQQIAAEAG